MKPVARLALFAGLFLALAAVAEASCPPGPQPRPCDCKCTCQIACIAPCTDSDGSVTNCGAWGVCAGQCFGGATTGEFTRASLPSFMTSSPIGEDAEPAVSAPAAFCGLTGASPATTANAKAN